MYDGGCSNCSTLLLLMVLLSRRRETSSEVPGDLRQFPIFRIQPNMASRQDQQAEVGGSPAGPDPLTARLQPGSVPWWWWGHHESQEPGASLSLLQVPLPLPCQVSLPQGRHPPPQGGLQTSRRLREHSTDPGREQQAEISLRLQHQLHSGDCPY